MLFIGKFVFEILFLLALNRLMFQILNICMRLMLLFLIILKWSWFVSDLEVIFKYLLFLFFILGCINETLFFGFVFLLVFLLDLFWLRLILLWFSFNFCHSNWFHVVEFIEGLLILKIRFLTSQLIYFVFLFRRF